MTVDELIRLAIVEAKEALTDNHRIVKLANIFAAEAYLMRAYKLVNEGKIYEQS